jgi:hypothetical protein
MEDKRKQKRSSSPPITRLLNQMQRLFKAEEFKQIFVRFQKIKKKKEFIL